jgi:hypothetical protein
MEVFLLPHFHTSTLMFAFFSSAALCVLCG